MFRDNGIALFMRKMILNCLSYVTHTSTLRHDWEQAIDTDTKVANILVINGRMRDANEIFRRLKNLDKFAGGEVLNQAIIHRHFRSLRLK